MNRKYCSPTPVAGAGTRARLQRSLISKAAEPEDNRATNAQRIDDWLSRGKPYTGVVRTLRDYLTGPSAWNGLVERAARGGAAG